MFTKNERITKKEDFDLIYKKGKIIKLPYLKVFYVQNNLSYNRFSVLISKKTANKATQRNYIKRKIRHIISLTEPDTKNKFNIIVLLYRGIEIINSATLQENFKTIFKKIFKLN